MFEKRLSRRLSDGRSDDRIIADPSAVLEDVISHLRQLLNVRQGSVPIRPDYGMPDINELIHLFPNAVDMLREEVRRQVETFEPRLRDVSVRHVPLPDQPLSLVYNVSATLLLDDDARRVTVETAVGDNGYVRLAS